MPQPHDYYMEVDTKRKRERETGRPKRNQKVSVSPLLLKKGIQRREGKERGRERGEAQSPVSL